MPAAEAETADRSALDAALDALHLGTIEPGPASIPELTSSFVEPMTATVEPATENGVATIPPEHSPAQSTELAEPEASAQEPPAAEPVAHEAAPAPEPDRPEVAAPPAAAPFRRCSA